MITNRVSSSLLRKKKQQQQQLRSKPKPKRSRTRQLVAMVAVGSVMALTNLFVINRWESAQFGRVNVNIPAKNYPQVRQEPASKNPPHSFVSEAVPSTSAASASASASVLPNAPDNVHIVFSTGCSIYQDWQSYALFYHIWKIGQPGNVTRVVSGCSPSEGKTLQRQFDSQIRATMRSSNDDHHKKKNDRFRLYFTPDYSQSSNLSAFRYFNKPMGLRHWLQYGLKYLKNANQYKDTVFILMDPDELFLRPIPLDYTDLPDSWFQWQPPDEPILHRRVQPGRPMGARFNYGTYWMDQVNVTTLLTRYLNNNDNTIQPSSPLLATWKQAGSEQGVHERYVVGPPYMINGKDFYRVVEAWASVVVAVHDMCNGDMLSEMFAYSIAAIHLDLPHQVVHNWMLSNVAEVASEEAWGSIDQLEWEDVCRPISNFTAEEQRVLPLVLHYCQSYSLGETYFFGKYTAPRAFLSCEHPLYKIPTVRDLKNDLETDIRASNNNNTKKETKQNRLEEIDKLRISAKRNAFMLCHLLLHMNEAALQFKHHECKNSNQEVNLNATYLWESKDKF